jgi:hypothetical protein
MRAWKLVAGLMFVSAVVAALATALVGSSMKN